MTAPERVFCCDQMRLNATVQCDEHRTEPWACPDVLVTRSEDGDVLGLPVRDGGSSFMMIRHCPWCGTDLRDSETPAEPIEVVLPTPAPASVLALRAAIMHVERTFDSADGEALADTLTVAVVDAGWRPTATVVAGSEVVA